MRCATLAELPPPPRDKSAWPWAEESPQLPDPMPDGSAWPKVSIVTPSYNQGQFIEETIRSVLLQGYPNLEYIIIDGGSTDNSVEIIRKYEPWLAHWVSEPDRGQGHAINKGLRVSSGQVMNWLNSDDCFKPGALPHVIAYFRSNGAAQVLCGFRQVFRGHRMSRITSVRAYLKPDRYTLSRCCYIAQETTFWKRSVWATIGQLDETFQFALDYDYWQRILAAGYRFCLLPCFLGLFRAHLHSKGTRQQDTRTRELARIYWRYLGTTKSEEQLRLEISPAWWRRMRLMHMLGRVGLLNSPTLAKAAVSALSLKEDEIPHSNPVG